MSTKGGNFHLVARLVLGGVFLYAGFVKIADPTAFAGAIAAYRLLPATEHIQNLAPVRLMFRPSKSRIF